MNAHLNLSPLSDRAAAAGCRGRGSWGRARQRAFTLVELLAVVAMVGILAVLAVVGYRKYLHAARSGEAKEIVGAIRVAQEAYRSETMCYLDCSSSLTAWYPAAPARDTRTHWVSTTHADKDCWRVLNVSVDAPTRFGFAVKAGAPGSTPPTPSTSATPTWPATTSPWYVVQAAGDQDGDGVLSYFVTSSFSGEIYAENESE